MSRLNSEIQVKLTQMNNEHQKEMSKLVANNKVIIRKIIVIIKKSKNKEKTV